MLTYKGPNMMNLTINLSRTGEWINLTWEAKALHTNAPVYRSNRARWLSIGNKDLFVLWFMRVFRRPCIVFGWQTKPATFEKKKKKRSRDILGLSSAVAPSTVLERGPAVILQDCDRRLTMGVMVKYEYHFIWCQLHKPFIWMLITHHV